MANNPETRMAAFDALPPEDRELANEYGVNVVKLYRDMGASDEMLKAACERHRVNRQREALVTISHLTLAKAITRKGVQHSLEQILQENLLREHENRIRATVALKTEAVIESARLDDEIKPLPKKIQSPYSLVTITPWKPSALWKWIGRRG